VTYHDAFAYFARRYGLAVVGVIETVPDVEPTPGHLRELRETVRRRQVKAIFTEPHHAGRLARQLGEDLNIPVGTLDTLESGPLQADAYEAGMRRNLRVLEQFLP
jgi:ABC-type Zn uptake system ZnuABC Zn-binding protein ZnuA